MDVRAVEVKVLACMLHQGHVRERLRRREAGLRLEYFLNPYTRALGRAILGYLLRYGDTPPDRASLVEQARADNPKLALVDVENLDRTLDEAYGDPEPGHYDFYRERLVANWRRSRATAGIQAALTPLERGDYAAFASSIQATLRGLEVEGDHVVRLAPFGRDARALVQEIERRRDAGVQASEFITTGLPWLDERLDGGWLRGENYLVFGHSGVGKSMFGTQAGYAAAQAGFNVAKFSLEMKARKDLYRLYARITGIPANLFLRRPWLIADEQLAQFRGAVERWSSEGHTYEIRSWDRRTTMDALRAELEGLSYVPDLVIVDQITDLAASLAWEDIAAVALDLQLLAKGWAGERGVAVLSFGQAKRGVLSERRYTTEDFKYGGAPTEWCTVVMYLSQTEQDREDRVINLGICKNRDGEETDDQMTLYPDQARGAIHSFEREAREGRADDVAGV